MVRDYPSIEQLSDILQGQRGDEFVLSLSSDDLAATCITLKTDSSDDGLIGECDGIVFDARGIITLRPLSVHLKRNIDEQALVSVSCIDNRLVVFVNGEKTAKADRNTLSVFLSLKPLANAYVGHTLFFTCTEFREAMTASDLCLFAGRDNVTGIYLDPATLFDLADFYAVNFVDYEGYKGKNHACAF